MNTSIELWPHQQINVSKMLDLLYHRMVAVDSSDTGTGKTLTALETVRRFNLPFVVICPKSVRSHWWGWVENFATAYPAEMPQCMGVLGWEAAKLGKAPEVYSKGIWFCGDEDNKYLVIFDEAHRSKNAKSLNSAMVRSASAQGIYLILASATLVQSVLDLGGLAFPLKLIQRQSYWFRFAQQFGARIHPRFGGYDDNSSKAQQLALRNLLDRIRVRTRREQIAGMRSCITEATLVDSNEVARIRAAYAELARKVRQLEAQKASAVEILTERLRGRQAIELLKSPVFVEQAFEHLEGGNKVALFFNFTESVQAAFREFKRLGVSCRTVTGETSVADRDASIKSFNAPNSELRALVLNIACGSEGLNLQDTNGAFPRIALFSPPESASILVQALGRIGGRIGARSVGLNRILFVAGTVEEEVHRHVRWKVRRLDNLNDGDLQWIASVSG